MLKSYFKIALRNLQKNKTHSFLNIAGLSVGMAVAMLIAIWIWDELSFNKYHQNHSRIAQVMQRQDFNGEIHTDKAIPMPLGVDLNSNYKDLFKFVSLSSWTNPHTISVGEKQLSATGNFMQPDAPQMLTLKMNLGNRDALKEPSSILLSESLSRSLFGDIDPIDRILKIDNRLEVKVAGVYEDLPYNSSFNQVSFIAPWDLYVSSEGGMEDARNNWNNNSFQLFVQIGDHEDMINVSRKIKNVKRDKIDKNQSNLKPEIFLHPMDRWHLYSEFVNGVNTGGGIQYVWMFGLIGFFVLLLAAINFMNLSTARSERRTKEVGIRKAVGSLRGQLVSQFFCESILVTFFSFLICLFLVTILLPFFNDLAGKKMSVPLESPLFWINSIAFVVITGLIAGSYPAFYLSSFNPVKVLKGTFKAGRFAAIPRKLLIVFQFAVSVILIIGTIVVFRQIQFAKNRPVGYDRSGLVFLRMQNAGLHSHFDAMRTDLIRSGLIDEVAESMNTIVRLGRTSGGFTWKDKSPGMFDEFAVVGVSPEYGKTVGWEFVAGRDFSKKFSTDSSGLIINEAAAKYMGLKNPIGETVIWNKKYTILGVVKNLVVGSPYDPVKQAVYYINPDVGGVINIRIKHSAGVNDALQTIKKVCNRYDPTSVFEYNFVDEEYAKKFAAEQRVGKLALVFTILAIFISYLGIFGLALFVAEQRRKEIGVRKVLGATIFNLWGLLSKDFVVLVIISLLIAIPLSYYFMSNWLQHYEYRSGISWWIFAAAGLGAILITILTVSYQSIKAALMNPVKSLRTE